MKERKAGAQMVLWGSGVNGDWVLWGVEWTRDWSLHWCLTPHMMTHIYSHPVFFLSEMQRLSELDDLCAYLSVKTLLMKIVCFHLYVHYTCRQMQRMQVHSYHFVIWCKSAECRCALSNITGLSWQSWQLINSVFASSLAHRWCSVAYVLWNLLSFY